MPPALPRGQTVQCTYDHARSDAGGHGWIVHSSFFLRHTIELPGLSSIAGTQSRDATAARQDDNTQSLGLSCHTPLRHIYMLPTGCWTTAHTTPRLLVWQTENSDAAEYTDRITKMSRGSLETLKIYGRSESRLERVSARTTQPWKPRSASVWYSKSNDQCNTESLTLPAC